MQKLTTNVVAGVVRDMSDGDTRLEKRPKLLLARRRDVGQNLVGPGKRIRCVGLSEHLAQVLLGRDAGLAVETTCSMERSSDEEPLLRRFLVRAGPNGGRGQSSAVARCRGRCLFR